MNKIIIICLSMIMWGNVFGQSKGITPLHLFFQKNADSTIVIEYPTGDYDPNYYKIITKTKDTINTFQYNAKPQWEKVIMPKMLKALIQIEKNKSAWNLADINVYFSSVDLPLDTLKSTWNEIKTLDLWKIYADNNSPNCKKRYAVPVHPDEIIIHLITREKIKTLHFYHALLYEENCPGNSNRKIAVKLYKLFANIFPKQPK